MTTDAPPRDCPFCDGLITVDVLKAVEAAPGDVSLRVGHSPPGCAKFHELDADDFCEAVAAAVAAVKN